MPSYTSVDLFIIPRKVNELQTSPENKYSDDFFKTSEYMQLEFQGPTGPGILAPAGGFLALKLVLKQLVYDSFGGLENIFEKVPK